MGWKEELPFGEKEYRVKELRVSIVLKYGIW